MFQARSGRNMLQKRERFLDQVTAQDVVLGIFWRFIKTGLTAENVGMLR